jgi:DNA-binding response OmpR family regulator
MAQILLIEPDKILAGHVRDYFANANHIVVSHHELQQAVSAADKALPAVVIMELQLAGRSGIEFLYEFRSYPDWQDVPVIIYSGLKGEELAAYDRVFKDLNVSRVLHKAETPLASLLKAAEEHLVPTAV